MNYKIIGVIIAVILLQLPFLYLAIYLHELSHKVDYRDIDKVDEDFCVLNDCGEAGSYTFSYYDYDDEKVKRVEQFTEYKAYFVTINILLCYILLSILIFLKTKDL